MDFWLTEVQLGQTYLTEQYLHAVFLLHFRSNVMFVDQTMHCDHYPLWPCLCCDTIWSELFVCLMFDYVNSQRPEAAPRSESEQATENTKKGSKKNGTVKATFQDDESKVQPSSGSQVNGSKAAEEKDGDVNALPVLTKEEEEDLALQRREERRRKDQEFATLLTKAWSRSGVQPLGRDRVFRRYWSFKSLKGLFVEDDDCEQHLLLQSDPESEPQVSCLDLVL